MGRKEIKKTRVEVQPMVKSISDEIVDVNKYNAEVIINPLTPVQADQALLTQVWINLISNALKYSAKKEQPKVEVGSYTDKNEIIYYVKDNGAGFDMEYADKLFGVFQRLHKANEFEGTGVGLAIVHRIVTKHGGRVWAEAKPNEGAIFSFALPE
jgi:light-regulated signal transduction histidine kinase (bacteriophytochrome)